MNNYSPSSILDFKGNWTEPDTTLHFGKTNNSDYQATGIIILPLPLLNISSSYNGSVYNGSGKILLPALKLNINSKFYNYSFGTFSNSLPLPTLNILIILRAQIIGNALLKLPINDLTVVSTGFYDVNVYRSIKASAKQLFEYAKLISKKEVALFKKSTTVKFDIKIRNEFAKLSGKFYTINFEHSKSIKSINNINFEHSKLVSISSSHIVKEIPLIGNFKQINFEDSKLISKTKSIYFEDMRGVRLANDVRLETSDLIKTKYSQSLNNACQMGQAFKEYFETAKRIYYSHNYNYTFETPEPEPEFEWPTPIISNEPYEYSTDLNFICNWVAPNTILHFGRQCQPQINLYDVETIIVTNKVFLTRNDTGEHIPINNFNIGISNTTYCWTFSANIPYTELAKVDILTEPFISVDLYVNGYIWTFILDSCDDNLDFNASGLNIKGRSKSIFLSEKYFAPRGHAFNQNITSRQIVENELNRNNNETGFNLDWNLIDPLGWQVMGDAYSYTDKTPISSIQTVATSVGGFVNSHTNADLLHVLSNYPVASWDWDNIENAAELSDRLIISQTRKRIRNPKYNGIIVTGEHPDSIFAFIRRPGTNGNLRPSMIVDSLITDQASAIERAKNELSAAGDKAEIGLTLPFIKNRNLMTPSSFIKMTGEDPYIGIVRSINISGSLGNIRDLNVVQKLVIERDLNGE